MTVKRTSDALIEFKLDDYKYGGKAISEKFKSDVERMNDTLQWAKDFMERYEQKQNRTRRIPKIS